jgi:uncharacterized membrane protein
MTTLVAVAFSHETTASAAAEDVQRLASDLLIEADAVAVISCDEAARFHVTTNHHAVEAGRIWGLFWLVLFSALFFVPSFGMPVGQSLGSLVRKIERSGLEAAFLPRVRELLQPGTSVLFLAVDPTVPVNAVEPLRRFGGTVVSTVLPRDLEFEVQRALHGSPAVAAS